MQKIVHTGYKILLLVGIMTTGGQGTKQHLIELGKDPPMGRGGWFWCFCCPFLPGSARKVFVVFIIFVGVSLLIYCSNPFRFATEYAHIPEQSRGSGSGYTPTETIYHDRIRFSGTQRRLPQVIIVGIRKCGTRALLEMLNLHPYIRKTGQEMHFFDDEETYAKGLEWYRKKMPYSFDDQLTVEKTPSYFISKEAPVRIRAMNESIRLLIIVREPTMRVVSDYTQISYSKHQRGIKVLPFKERVLLPDGEVNESYKAIYISKYAVHILRWLRMFSKDQIHIVDGDKLIEDPYTEMDKVQKFLNLPPRITPENFYFNETKGFYCMRNETFRKCLNDSKGRRHPDVNPEVVSRLRKFFAPLNDKFYELVGHNYSWPTS
ncbi:heparan sulfate glucosamine 3-O-sulfotransferase 1-like isoform X2 [Oratosquilla oratoria]|uniref:heparan sulfate glucosamine 3-O-sulfotransferase 1-like isoform X2 n=1 Tax=Oratosquilla oratoria TaxID=337810 RepID=UPI003F76FED1